MSSLIQENISLKKYTSWKVGGEAEYFSSPQNIDEVKEVLSWAHKNSHPITYLGQGSNVLISDQGISGLVLSTRRLQEMEDLSSADQFLVKCETGVLKYKLMRLFLKYSLDPALFLSGIPGDIGGGVVMNAGVSESIIPREFNEIIKSVDVLQWTKNSIGELEFELKTFENENIEWTYRHSKGWQPGLIMSALIHWPLDAKNPEIAEQVKQAINLRRLKQPLDKPSCGSVFVNPKGHSSGALIESAGLKGFTIGGAQVSNKHANFIVNTGTATAKDIHQVISHVQSKVFEKHKVQLHTEVVYMGQWSH